MFTFCVLFARMTPQTKARIVLIDQATAETRPIEIPESAAASLLSAAARICRPMLVKRKKRPKIPNAATATPIVIRSNLETWMPHGV